MSASTSKAAESSNPAEQNPQENLPNLGVLEEDDEFEEFAVAGQLFSGYMIFVLWFYPLKPMFIITQIGQIRKHIWLILKEEYNLEQQSLEGTNFGKTIGMMMILRMDSAFN